MMLEIVLATLFIFAILFLLFLCGCVFYISTTYCINHDFASTKTGNLLLGVLSVVAFIVGLWCVGILVKTLFF